MIICKTLVVALVSIIVGVGGSFAPRWLSSGLMTFFCYWTLIYILEVLP